MTREETIKKLDDLIADLNSCKGMDLCRNNIEQKVLSSLKGLPISASTLSAIRNIRSAINIPNEMFHHSSIEGFMREHDTRSIVEMINILNQEKGIQVQAMQDEAQKENLAQQKRSNKIQIWTLICSIVAALAALYPIVRPLVEKIFN